MSEQEDIFLKKDTNDQDTEPLIETLSLDSLSSFDSESKWDLKCTKKRVVSWIISLLYVIFYSSFLVFTAFALTEDKNKGNTHTQYPYILIATFTNVFFSIRPSLLKKESITRKDIIYNIFSGFIHSCYLSLLYFSSGTHQTNLTQQSLLIGSGIAGYAGFSYVWKFKNLRKLELFLSLILFVIGIGSVFYYFFQDSSSKIYQVLYLLAHIFHGVYTGIVEHLWNKNKKKDGIHSILSSLVSLFFVLAFSGLDVLSFKNKKYIEVLKSFSTVSIKGIVSSTVFYPLSNLFHHLIHYEKKDKSIFMNILVPVSVFIISLILDKGETEEIAILSSGFSISIVLLFFKMREIIKRHAH